MSQRPRRLLAIASGGGHWVQLLRLRPAFAGLDVLYVTVSEQYRVDVDDGRFKTVPDATRWDRLGLLKLLWSVLWIVLRERPHAVVTTGAAPGYLALCIGKCIGAKTVWIDSIANCDEISMSGRKSRRWADLWLTQWEHLAEPGGPTYRGSVL